MKLLTIKNITEQTGFKKSTIYKFIKTKNFPKPRKFGKSSRWLEEEVEEWIQKEINKGDKND
jgi:prophage regulatory protein